MDDDVITREEVAELFGVAPVTVDAWTNKGMPIVRTRTARSDRAAGRRSWEVTRRDLAVKWDVHVDTISKWLTDGLGAAIIKQHRGKLVFDFRVATRWKAAYDKTLNAQVLDDFAACAKAGVFALHAIPVTTLLEDEDAPIT